MGVRRLGERLVRKGQGLSKVSAIKLDTCKRMERIRCLILSPEFEMQSVVLLIQLTRPAVKGGMAHN